MSPHMSSNKQSRTRVRVNSGWRFAFSQDLDTLRDGACIPPGLAWRDVSLPHTWTTFESTGADHVFIRDNPHIQVEIKQASLSRDPLPWMGYGWYTRCLPADPAWRDRLVRLEFDGAEIIARVWVNGRFAGEHLGGFSSFCIDLTAHLNHAAENIITVAVCNNPWIGNIPPMDAGNWNVYGGLYRSVWLVTSDRLHIPFQGSADHEGGTFIMTPEVSAAAARLEMLTHVRNEAGTARDCAIVTQVIAPDGAQVLALRESARLAPGAGHCFRQGGGLLRPCLWSLDAPNLYRVITEVYDGDRLADTYESPLGFRWWEEAEPGKLMRINGREVHMHGSSLHQDYAWLGTAMPDWLHEKDMRDLKRIGVNFLRTVHFPQAPLIYDLADQLGIVICEEVPCIKNRPFSPRIQEQMVREMIRRDRNHPSVFYWSVGNETKNAADSAWAVAEDPTRPITCRSAEGCGNHITPNCPEMEQHSWTLQLRDPGNYEVEHAHCVAGMDRMVEGTEIGYLKEDEHCTVAASEFDGTRRIFKQGAHWLYNDYGCMRRFMYGSLKELGAEGWVDPYRRPKYFYHYFRACFAPEPNLFIEPHRWTRGFLGTRQEIAVFSNCDEVELFVNGHSLGRKTRNVPDPIFLWQVPVESGELTAVGRRGDAIVRERLLMAGEPAAFALIADPPCIEADLAGLTIVTARIVDAQGVEVFGARNPISWSVAGPGTLVGASLYESQAGKGQVTSGAYYIDCPVSMPVRSAGKPGEIVVTASSPGLMAGNVRIEAR